MSARSSRVQSNLIQQNCFVRDVLNKSDLASVSSDKFYETLDEVTTSKGVEINRSVEPYPITSQYVNSFLDSTDYRKDPVAAVSNGVNRSNLGDITAMQDISKLDSSSARALYEQLSKRFSSQTTSQATPQTAPQTTSQATPQTTPQVSTHE